VTTGPAAALIVLLTLAAVLLVSGVAKLHDQRATRDAFDALRVPAWVPADTTARALPWAEIVLAVALLALPSPWSPVAAAGVLLLMLSYTAVIGRALTFDEPVTCSCFGSIGRHDVDRLTLARNVLLTMLAGTATWFALDGGSAPEAVADLDAQGWSVLAATAAAAAMAVLVAGVRTSSATAARAGDGEPLDYERRAVPYGTVAFADGRTATLAELARTQAQLVVIIKPGCGPCVRIGAQLDEWASRLAPAVGVLAVYPEVAAGMALSGHAPELAAFDPGDNVRRVFDVSTPSAVLLGADGLLAGGPVVGEDNVAALVMDLYEELAAASSR
jgi:uncharacterized membrane protein YphA (DoxX/SURF4 family)